MRVIYRISVYFIILLLLSACSVPLKPWQTLQIGKEERAKQVVLLLQGGPSTRAISYEDIKGFPFNRKRDLLINVQQEQIRNRQRYLSEEITFEQAKQVNMKSVQLIQEAAQYYRAKGNYTIHLVGLSYGAFLAAEFLVHHESLVDNVIIGIGRLNIPEEVWRPFSQGLYVDYAYIKTNGVIEQILSEERDGTITERNMSRIAAGVGYRRYVELLKEVPLTKLTYVYSQYDEAVGPLDQEEIGFLKQKGARVIVVSGDHIDGFERSLALLGEHLDQLE